MIEHRIDSGIDMTTISVRPPRAEEEQDHQRRQPGGDRPFLQHALDGLADEHRLVEQQLDLQLRRQLRLDAGQRRPDARRRRRACDAPSPLRIGSSTARLPSRRTTLVCTA